MSVSSRRKTVSAAIRITSDSHDAVDSNRSASSAAAPRSRRTSACTCSSSRIARRIRAEPRTTSPAPSDPRSKPASPRAWRRRTVGVKAESNQVATSRVSASTCRTIEGRRSSASSCVTAWSKVRRWAATSASCAGSPISR